MDSNINSAVTTQELGNFVTTTNVYSIPELSPADAGDIVPFKPVLLYDTATATRGSASGTNIGVARVRAIEHSTGTDSTNFISDTAGNSSEVKFHLFEALFCKTRK